MALRKAAGKANRFRTLPELVHILQNNLSKTWRDIVKSTNPQQEKFTEKRLFCDFTEKNAFDNWVCVADSQFGGFSWCKLSRSKTGKALFHGTLSTEVPEGDEAEISGFCAMRSMPNYSPITKKVLAHEVGEHYQAVEMRLRGDGRTYCVNIQPEGFQNEDLWQTFVYTRGGPQWETVQLPFTKFLLTNDGYVQDYQIEFWNIRTMGITLMDRVDGPFALEIDYMKFVELMVEPIHFRSHYENRLIP